MGAYEALKTPHYGSLLANDPSMFGHEQGLGERVTLAMKISPIATCETVMRTHITAFSAIVSRQRHPVCAKAAGRIIPLLLASLFSFPSLGAEIYRWVDENGVVNYTQQKPRDVNANQVASTKPSRLKKAGSTQKQSANPPSELTGNTEDVSRAAATPAKAGLAEPDAAARAKYEAAVEQARVKGCADAKKLVDQLQNRGRIRIRNAAGEEVAMSDAERASRINKAQAMIAEHCTT